MVATGAKHNKTGQCTKPWTQQGMLQGVANVELIRSIHGISADLVKELDGIADRAFKLSKHAAQLEAHSKKSFAEKGVQADAGAVAGQNYKLDRARRLAPFAFKPFSRRQLPWKKIRAMSMDRLIHETDTRSLMELFDDIAHVDLESESAFNLTESNLMKLIQLSQLMLQYMQWNVEQGAHQAQLLTEERTALAATLRGIPNMTLKPVSDGLVELGNKYARMGEADLDAMFLQVRTEERLAANDLLHSAVDQAKHELSERTKAVQSLPDPYAVPQQPTPASQQLPGASYPDGRVPAQAPQVTPAAVTHALKEARLNSGKPPSLFAPGMGMSLVEQVRAKQASASQTFSLGASTQASQAHNRTAQIQGPSPGLAAAYAAYEAAQQQLRGSAQPPQQTNPPVGYTGFRPSVGGASDPPASAHSTPQQAQGGMYSTQVQNGTAGPQQQQQYPGDTYGGGTTGVQQYSMAAVQGGVPAQYLQPQQYQQAGQQPSLPPQGNAHQQAGAQQVLYNPAQAMQAPQVAPQQAGSQLLPGRQGYAAQAQQSTQLAPAASQDQSARPPSASLPGSQQQVQVQQAPTVQQRQQVQPVQPRAVHDTAPLQQGLPSYGTTADAQQGGAGAGASASSAQLIHKYEQSHAGPAGAGFGVGGGAGGVPFAAGSAAGSTPGGGGAGSTATSDSRAGTRASLPGPQQHTSAAAPVSSSSLTTSTPPVMTGSSAVLPAATLEKMSQYVQPGTAASGAGNTSSGVAAQPGHQPALRASGPAAAAPAVKQSLQGSTASVPLPATSSTTPAAPSSTNATAAAAGTGSKVPSGTQHSSTDPMGPAQRTVGTTSAVHPSSSGAAGLSKSTQAGGAGGAVGTMAGGAPASNTSGK